MTNEEREQTGGVSIGHLSGGAVAAGDHAVAEDRSQRVGEAAPVVPAAPPAGSPSGIAIGAMSGGAVAAGAGARAVDSSVHLDASARQLLTSVRTLRQQLPLLARAEGDGVAQVEGELEAVGTEIEQTGTAGRSRLERLRDLLKGAGTVVSGLASALAVVQAIEQFLG
ncbi:hypothetical protein [Kitasatospora aureofaciens]|uniref:hypothetical protein n=1 Tax=Kitasatospora aureofaciens TaxID=1894 RepID=UPI001C46260C|nr:hypothetical protein [Kitasatospora aureofaciens]MBV6699265.1 hypothetical protein [Kitasatospora aureofaciens]